MLEMLSDLPKGDKAPKPRPEVSLSSMAPKPWNSSHITYDLLARGTDPTRLALGQVAQRWGLWKPGREW